MAVLNQEKVDQIKRYLRWHPRGMSISDLSSKVNMNRNLVAKYLDVLHISGQVEMEMIGAARVYFLSQRVPISTMLEFSSDYVIVLDTEQRVIQVNEPVLTFLNAKREALVGKKIGEIHHPFFYDLPLLEPAENGRIVSEKIVEIQIVVNNETLHFRVKLMPTVFENGGHGVTYIIEDITVKKRNEESLQISEARYRGIVEDQMEFITRYRPDGTLTFVNESYARYLGRRPQDLLGNTHMPGIYEEDRMALQKLLVSLVPDHPVSTLECRISEPDGRLCWNLWTIRALFDDAGIAREYQGVGLDITEKKEAAARINNYLKTMEFFSRKLQEFLELPPDTDIYQEIGAGLEELFPSGFIVVNTFENLPCTLTVRAVLGETVRDCIARNVGDHFIGMVIPVDERVPETLKTGKISHIPLPFYEIVFRQVPEEACTRIIEDLSLGDFYSIGMTWQGRLYGNMLIGLPKGEKIVNAPFVEIYSRAAAIALRRRFSEDALKESERERAEEALRNSENYLVKIFNSTQSGLVIIDPGTHTIFDANSTATDLIGTDKSNLVGSSCKKWLCATEDGPCPVIDLGLEVVRSEGTLKQVGGETRSIIKTVVPVRMSGREYLLESFVDITERKAAEEALRESEEKYRLVVENSHDAIFIYRDRQFLFVSSKATELTGYSHDELMEMEVWDLIHPDDRAPLQASAQRRMAGEALSSLFNARVLTRARDVRQGEFFVNRINYLGQPAILGIFRDVTERVRAEEALRQSEELYRTLTETSPGMIYLIDTAGTICFTNTTGAAQFGATPEEIIGKPISEIFNSCLASRHMEAINAVIATGNPLHTEIPGMIPGSVSWIDAHLAPVRDKDGRITAVLGVSHDITDRKAVEQKLRENEARLDTILHSSPIPKYVIDANHRVMYWNKALEEFSGIRARDVIGTTRRWQTVEEPDRPCLADLMIDGGLEFVQKWYRKKITPSQFIDGAIEVMDFFPQAGKGGDGKWLHHTAVAIKDDRGQTLGAVETIEDVTARHHLDRLKFNYF